MKLAILHTLVYRLRKPTFAWELVLVIGLGSLLVACGWGAETPAEAPAATSPGALVDVPVPAFDSLEPHVRDQLQAGQARLEEALTDSLATGELANLFGEQGKRYLAYEFYGAALACFKNAAWLAPQDYAWAYYLGYVERERGNLEESRSAFEQAMDLNRDYRPTYVALAALEIEANNLDRAARLLDEVLAQDERVAAALFLLGRIALLRQDYEQAISHLEAARRLAPTASEINYPLGLAYRGRGNEEKARAFLQQRGREKAPLGDPLIEEIEALVSGKYAFQNLGNEAYLQGRYQEAYVAFQKVLEIDPESVDAHTNLGAALSRIGEVERAATHFREALRLEPQNALANYSMGALLAQQQQEAAAISYYQKALATRPDYREAAYNLANVYFRLSQYSAALPYYRQVLTLEPLNGQAHYGVALSLIRMGHWQEAYTALEQSRQVLPENAPLTNALVRLLAACPEATLRDGPRAVELAQRLVQSEKSLTNIEALAMALAEVGRFAEAIQLQQQGLAAARQAQRADLVAMLEANLGRYQFGQPARIP